MVMGWGQNTSTYKASGSSMSGKPKGPSGLSGGMFDQILGMMQSGQQGQQQSSQNTYDNLMRTLMETMGRTRGLMGQQQQAITGVGDRARRDVLDRGQQRSAGATQQALSSGLGNTTIMSALQRGVNSDTERDMRTVDEDVSRRQSDMFGQQAGMEMGLGQMMGQGILSRNDQQIDPMAYINLLAQLG